jgi:mono/diheme cytochrome c family protein
MMPDRLLLWAAFASVLTTGIVLAVVARVLPRPSRRPLWTIVAALALGAIALLAAVLLPRDPAPRFGEELLNPIAVTPESVAVGEAIYRDRCLVCHGPSGGGNGPGAAGLDPPVSDFRVHLVAGHSDGRFFHWISEGIPGTAMPAFKGTLSAEQRWHVINFVRHTFTPAEK